ncbi:UNVERIFIED_CONTAM: hypothetical protein GTU68_060621 [Idotea baltica]|nr:hypothetical protein [Idotea baltica]
MDNVNHKVNFFFEEETKWKEAYNLLRKLVLECGLSEELKWGKPCYVRDKTNVVLIHGFRDYCALLFHKGVLLNDSDRILIQQTKNVQSARQIRFTDASEIAKMKSIIQAYIFEAIEVEKAGLKVELKKHSEYPIPEEFQSKLDEDPVLKTAFQALTPGRQRGYLLYFSGAKQSKTRQSRVEKYVDWILQGKGLRD